MTMNRKANKGSRIVCNKIQKQRSKGCTPYKFIKTCFSLKCDYYKNILIKFLFAITNENREWGAKRWYIPRVTFLELN